MKYTEEDLWIEDENDEAVIGITDFALEELGKLVYIDTPTNGSQATRDEPLFVVEGEENTVEYLSPLDGVVVDINPATSDSLNDIEEDPTDHGWIIRIEMDDPEQLDELMSENEYRKMHR